MQKSITFSDDLNIDYDSGQNSKRHFSTKIAIGIIEFLTSSVFYSYGVLFSEYVPYEFSYAEGLLTTLLYICCYGFTDPFSRLVIKYLENNRYNCFRCLMFISTMILFIGVMMPVNIVVYGVTGGVCSNFIFSMLRYVSLEKFGTDPKVFQGNIQIARSLSLFIMPHMMLLLVTHYKINGVRFIYSAVLLHIIPAALLIRTESAKVQSQVDDMLRYSTLPGRFSSQLTEMQEFRLGSTEANSDSSSSEEFEEENTNFTMSEDFPDTHIVDDLDVPNSSDLQASTVQMYYRNAGVSILPEIPEENEDEDDINFIDPKRVSRISTVLEELNQRKDSVRGILNVNDLVKIEKHMEKIDKIEYIPDYRDDGSNPNFLEELKSFNRIKDCCCFTPYAKYVLSRKLRVLKYFLIDSILRPFYVSVKNVFFYPALVTKTTTTLVSALYITLAPFLALKKNLEQNIVFSTEDATFLLTYIAFAWCFFLVALPIVIKLSVGKIRIIFTFGLLVSGTGLLLLYKRPATEMITISSLLFGFGHGISSYTEHIVLKEYTGTRSWSTIQGSLEISCAVIVIVIYHCIHIYKVDMSTSLLVASLFYYGSAVFWNLVPYLKYGVDTIKVFWTRNSHHQHHSFLYS